MSLFFGILKNTWLLAFMKIRIFYPFYDLVTITAKQSNTFAKVDLTRCFIMPFWSLTLLIFLFTLG